MIEPKRIFVDTSAWIEYIFKDEVHHKEVDKYFTSEIATGSKFFTSDYVLDETYTRLITRGHFREAKKLKDKTRKAEKSKSILILWTDATIFKKAWNFFEKFKEHKLSFTDATIYTFVKDLKIDEVLTLDKGFKKVGLTIKPTIR